jgi:hypothetical protein
MKYDPIGENPFPAEHYSLDLPESDATPERGDRVKKVGVQGEGKLVSISKDRNTVVVAWKGFGWNPGSRYSGFYSYYPAETEVLVYDHTDEHNRRRYRSLISWPTRAPKKEGG